MNFIAILHKQIQDERQRILVLEFREKLKPYPEALGALTQRIQGSLRIERFLNILLREIIDNATINDLIEHGIKVGPLSANADEVTKMVYVLDQTMPIPRCLLANFNPLEKESRVSKYKGKQASGYVTKRISRK